MCCSNRLCYPLNGTTEKQYTILAPRKGRWTAIRGKIIVNEMLDHSAVWLYKNINSMLYRIKE